jgi:hypothetical protein
VIAQALDPPPDQAWATLRACLKADDLRDSIEALRPAGASSASLLRLLDVAIWMLHSQSRNATAARCDASINLV